VTKKFRLAYLVSHPIQYQAPLLKQLSEQSDIDLTVFFCSDLSIREYRDEGFGTAVKWDVPLLDGYRYEFLPRLRERDGLSFWNPLNYGIRRRLRAGKFDALWVHGWGYWSHLYAIYRARRLGIKVLLRGESGVHLGEARGLARRVRDALMAFLRRHVSGFLTIGTFNREYYLRHGVPASRLFSVPYSVDNAFFRNLSRQAATQREALRAELGLEPGRPIILYASKMISRKRPADLLDAYLALSPDGVQEPRPYLLFIGDGELRAGLETQAATLNWRSIRFLGFKNQTELPRYFDLCDVFVLPSEREPWGLIVNEVMNAGRAVIVGDEVGCARDLVRDGENGYVVKTGDVQGLRDAIRRVVDDPQRAQKMGQVSLDIIGRWGFQEDIQGIRAALQEMTGWQ